MKNPLKMAIAILDRTPATTKGQSLVELTLTLPILLIMLMGLLEVGWLANNYLILVDVTREAGRFGATKDPTEWNEAMMTYSYQYMDCDTRDDLFTLIPGDGQTTYQGPNLPGYDFGIDGPQNYFDSIACTVVIGMQPLEFKDDRDDVVISVFTYIVDAAGNAIITGRFPGNSNRCADDDRDPFAPPFLLPDDRDQTRVSDDIENQRGYLFRGNFAEAGCRGSKFSLQRMTDLLNRTSIFDDGSPLTNPERDQIPNNGILLVEVFWEHEQLLGLPFVSWLANPIDLHVWSFFPVSAAEPTATAKP